VLASRMKILGSDHPRTLAIEHELAKALLGQGKLAEATQEFRDVFMRRSSVLGPDHPDTLLTAEALRSLGKGRDPGP
jgi:hypothetical protein